MSPHCQNLAWIVTMLQRSTLQDSGNQEGKLAQVMLQPKCTGNVKTHLESLQCTSKSWQVHALYSTSRPHDVFHSWRFPHDVQV